MALIPSSRPINAISFSDDLIGAINVGDIDYLKSVLTADPALILQHDTVGDTLLMKAAQGRYVDIVLLLLKNGALLDAGNHAGYTALMHAVMHDRIDNVELLLHAGARACITNNEGHRAIDLAMAYPGLYHQEIIESLLYDRNTVHICCSKDER